MWQIEWKRLLRSKGLYVSLALGIGLAIWHFVSIILPMLTMMEEMLQYAKGGFSLMSAYEIWMNSSTFPQPTFLFFLVLPILSVMPYGLTYDQDRKSGWIKNVCVREEKRKYLQIKLCIAFVSGMLVVIVPLLLNFMLAATCLPLKAPQLINVAMRTRNIWYELFYFHPMVYVLVLLLIDGIYGGLMAILPILLSHSTDYGFLVGIMPFIYHLFLFSLFNLIGIADLAPVRFLCGGVSVNYYLEYGLVGVAVVLVLLMAYRRGIKTDVY